MIFPLLLMKALLRSNNTRKNGLDFGLIRALRNPKMAVIHWRLFPAKPKKLGNQKRIEDKVYYVLRLFGCLN